MDISININIILVLIFDITFNNLTSLIVTISQYSNNVENVCGNIRSLSFYGLIFIFRREW